MIQNRIQVASLSSIRPLFQDGLLSSDLSLHVKNEKLKEDSAFFKTPEVVALCSRLRLDFSNPELIGLVLIRHSQLEGLPSNERLLYLGKKALNLYLGEFYYIKYPHLSTLTIETIIRIHYNPIALSSVGQAFGMAPLLRLQDKEIVPEKDLDFQKLLGKSVQTLVGAIYHDQGAKQAKNFIHKFIISPDVDISPLLPLEDPKRRLRALLKILDKEEPIPRLLKETGRLSNRPIFIVGIFSGVVKLGEGYGSSLKMAEFKAYKDSMLRYYLKEYKDFQLPSDVESIDNNTVPYTPVKLSNSPTRI